MRDLYSFARKPDAAFYFRVPIEVAVGRLLGSRAKIKFYEAGMDLGLSTDPVESFRLFQGRVIDEYDRLTGEYGFRVIDGTKNIDTQQRQVRDIVRRLYDEPATAEAS